jgi:hypothetical protein
MTINLEWMKMYSKSLINRIHHNNSQRKVEVGAAVQLRIANRNFYAFDYKNGEPEFINNSNLHTANIIVFTQVNQENLLTINFNCAASNCDSFIPKMYKALKTVEIKPN